MASTKRDDLCDAALALFAEQGIAATTTREIAERAGTAEGTLYRHFESKDALVEWLFGACARRFDAVLAEAVDEQTGPRDQLRGLVRGVFSFAEAHPASFDYLLSVHHTGLLETLDGPPPPMQRFMTVLRNGMEAGVFRDLPPPLATGWIVAMAQRAVVFQGSPLVDRTPDAVIDQTVAAALRLVAPEEE
jgi:AcrR family transcriptional regulator